MNKVKRDGTGIPIRVYRPGLFSLLVEWLLHVVIGVSIVSICFLPLFLDIAYRYNSLVSGDYRSYYFVILMTMLVFLYFAYRRHYLAIYENGIVLSTPLKRIFSSWENVNSLEVAKSPKGVPSHYYLLTKEDVDESVKRGQNEISLARYSRVSVSRNTDADYNIMPTGQLGQDLQRYAPQLFE